jgi:hypothetical protein
MNPDREVSRERRRRLEAGKSAYLAQFGEDAPKSSCYLDNPRLPDLLMEAAEGGEPLTTEALAEGLGGPHTGRWSGP